MKKTTPLFGYRRIFTALASYVGLGSLGWAGYLLVSGAVSAWWLVPFLVCTFFLLMSFTVGAHRLFTHSAFETSQAWHAILAYIFTLSWFGSTVQHASLHAMHHQYSDTEKDPKNMSWTFLFWKDNPDATFNNKVLLKMYRSKLHRFLYDWYVLVIVGTAAVLWLINPYALLFCYLAPLGWQHLVSSPLQVWSHRNKAPANQPWMEFLLFTGGEWMHKGHHDDQRNKRFGNFDVGYWFIRLIETKAS